MSNPQKPSSKGTTITSAPASGDVTTTSDAPRNDDNLDIVFLATPPADLTPNGLPAFDYSHEERTYDVAWVMEQRRIAADEREKYSLMLATGWRSTAIRCLRGCGVESPSDEQIAAELLARFKKITKWKGKVPKKGRRPVVGKPKLTSIPKDAVTATTKDPTRETAPAPASGGVLPTTSDAPSPYKAHPLLLTIFPWPTAADIERAKERITLYGTNPIEVIGDRIVVGLVDYCAAYVFKIAHHVTTIAEPPNLVDYIVRRNLPSQNFDDLRRGLIAVLAYKETCKLAGRARMSEGGRNKGREETTRPCQREEQRRWFDDAARIVGVKPNLVKRLDRALAKAPDLIDYVKMASLFTTKDVADLAKMVPRPKDRAEILSLWTPDKRKGPIRFFVSQWARARAQKGVSDPLPAGKSWTVLHGDMLDEALKLPPHSFDVVFADIVYEDPEMAQRAARAAKHLLVDGGLFILMPGLSRWRESDAAASKVLTPVPSFGVFHLGGCVGGRLKGRNLVEIDPVFFYSNAAPPIRLIKHLYYPANMTEPRAPDAAKAFHKWGKDLDGLRGLLASVTAPGSRIADLCCGGANMGAVALKMGCDYVGIDIDPDAVKASRLHLAEVDKEIASEDLARIVRAKKTE